MLQRAAPQGGADQRPVVVSACARSRERSRARFVCAGGGTNDAKSSDPNHPAQWTFINEHVIGSGSFGVVYQAIVKQTGKEVAIKKVLQDKRFKNRELQIMKMLEHTNVTTLHHFFYSEGEKPDETFLNLVMDFVPQTVYSMSRSYSKAKKTFPLLYLKLYVYQLSRIHPLARHLPPGHQAAESARAPGAARTQALRLWERQDARQG